MAPFYRKLRTCRRFTGETYFKPQRIPIKELEISTLELDELEAMHLCDYEDLEQKEAAQKMGVSTSTLQRLLYSGRKKTIDFLYNSKALRITRHEQILEKRAPMKILIPNEHGLIAQHFGHASFFTLFEIADGKIISETTIPNPGHEPGLLPKLFHDQGVNLVIAADIGSKALNLFQTFNIEVLSGVSGNPQTIIQQFLTSTLQGHHKPCHGPHRHGQINCQHHEEQ